MTVRIQTCRIKTLVVPMSVKTTVNAGCNHPVLAVVLTVLLFVFFMAF